MAKISAQQSRILLSRDRGLLKRRRVTHGYCPRSDQPRRQLAEVLARFDLYRAAAPFTRCMRCNGELRPVEREAVAAELPPRVRRRQQRFLRCTDCGQLYWPGTHYQRLRRLVEEVLAEGASSGTRTGPQSADA